MTPLKLRPSGQERYTKRQWYNDKYKCHGLRCRRCPLPNRLVLLEESSHVIRGIYRRKRPEVFRRQGWYAEGIEEVGNGDVPMSSSPVFDCFQRSPGETNLFHSFCRKIGVGHDFSDYQVQFYSRLCKIKRTIILTPMHWLPVITLI